MKIDYSSIEGKFPKIYKNKKLILAGLLGGGFLIIATFAIFLQEDGGVSEKIASAKKEINISNVTRKVRADDVWLEKAESQLIELNKNVELLARENKRMSEEIKENFL